jgi:S1-C subfamily serine protease
MSNEIAMTKSRAGLIAVTLFVGIVIGLVLMGRLSPQTGSAAPASGPLAQAKPAAISPTGAVLPNLSDVAERALQATVNISSTQYRQVDPFFQMFYRRGALMPETSLGSGVIVSEDGLILSNHHVLQNAAAEIKVTLPDGRELAGKVVGTDPVTDLGVVKVSATGLAPLPWGDSSKLRVAEWVLAVGSPLSLSQTVTLGIVSNVKRHSEQLGGINDMIQTDAAINPGNSGGPLVNSRGEVVGINTMIVTETGGYQGLGFAIPANAAQDVMNELIKYHEVPHGSIGLTDDLVNVDPARAQRAGLGPIRGVLVRNMYSDSSAYHAGMQLNDIILSVDGKDISDAAQLQRLIIGSKIGSTVTIEVMRNNRRLTLKVPIEKLVAGR